MYIQSIEISGFRCFGPQPITITLSKEITAFIGMNASGKTAILQALEKMFGVSNAKRSIQKTDFYVNTLENPDIQENKSLFIEVILAFPELEENSTQSSETVPPCFKYMTLTDSGESPFCRLRLIAEWEDDGTSEGSISQKLYWIRSPEYPNDKNMEPVSASDRGLIQLYYIPASRDTATVVRTATREISTRLLRAIEWSKQTKEDIYKASKDLSQAFEKENPISEINQSLGKHWKLLHDENTDIDPSLNLVSHQLDEIIKKINVLFQQGNDRHEHTLEMLSDGQQSLF